MGDQLKIGAPPDGPLESGGVASGGVPASLMEFKSNKTIGRIKTLECLKSSDPKACEKAHLDELSQRYADHASGKMPLPPDESLELRAQIQKLDSELYPDRTSLWPDYSPAEKDYLAQKAAEKRRFANNIGILGGGLVFAGLPAMGRVLNAPEDVVEQLGVLNVELVGAFGLKGNGQRVIKPVPRVVYKPASPGNGTFVLRPKKTAAKGRVQVTEKGLARVESHLSQFGDDAANTVMVQRLRAGQATQQDLNFYMHELKESAFMRQGLDARAAHGATLKWQGIPYKAGYEAQLYSKDAIQAGGTTFSPAARRAAGLE